MTYQRPADAWVIEGIVTTQSASGVLNVAPMGPVFDPAWPEHLLLRPFRASRTHSNLREHGEAVFHAIDDALLLARAAIGKIAADDPLASIQPARRVRGMVLTGACRYHELEVEDWRDDADRPGAWCRIVEDYNGVPWRGYCRASHVVLEAAILVTRLHLTGPDDAMRELKRLHVIVGKTGSDRHRQAFEEMEEYVRQWPGSANPV